MGSFYAKASYVAYAIDWWNSMTREAYSQAAAVPCGPSHKTARRNCVAVRRKASVRSDKIAILSYRHP